jgi:hemerythrin-like metal-binding protein
MTLIKWHSGLNVNIGLIDEQHKLLVKRLNDLHDAMIAGKDRAILGNLLNQLGVYASMHFAREEDYMERFGYPDIERHRKEHNDFERTIHSFEKDFLDGRKKLSLNIIAYLVKWLANHILNSDKKIGPYLLK